MTKFIEGVDSPDDLQGLSLDELNALAEEIRELIITTLSCTGGHLAANLGVVELTIALLRAFRPPVDKIVWDVSHQTYTYKILTGRRRAFGTLRQFGGISGFSRRDESEYDAFGAGHAGTALSAALGMAVARDRRGGKEHVIAVLGDGSVGCGISLEALNNVSGTTSRLIVVLNDNEMSISANVGALARYLGKLLGSVRYNRWKGALEAFATRLRMGWLRKAYYRVEEAIKSVFLRSVIFEELGLRYVGPIDGHNLHELQQALQTARESPRPMLLHVTTQKGRGYSFAEALPDKWHGTPGFDIASGERVPSGEGPSYSEVFGTVLSRLAARDRRVVAITAGMAAGTGLSPFAETFPDRFFDVGISEEHAMVFAAGLAAEGCRPFFVVYSTFLQRAVDCLIHDVCLQRLPVVVCLDRAGIVGDDGPTHHGVFDIALCRCIPELMILQPRDECELARMLATALDAGRPTVIRYPRGRGTGAGIPQRLETLPVGLAETVREGAEAQIWALGDLVPLAERAAEELERGGVSAGVVNARFVNPIDAERLRQQGLKARVFVSLENGSVTGGFGESIQDLLASTGYAGRVVKMGWPHEFIPQGSSSELMARYGLTSEAVVEEVRRALGKPARNPDVPGRA